MSNYWIKTEYVPEDNEYFITKGKWYKLENFSDDYDGKYGDFQGDNGQSIGVYILGSSWLYGKDWEFYEGENPPDSFFDNKEVAEDSVIVPISDLKAIEEARGALFDLLQEQCKDYLFLSKFVNITAALYKVGNFKYPKAD